MLSKMPRANAEAAVQELFDSRTGLAAFIGEMVSHLKYLETKVNASFLVQGPVLCATCVARADSGGVRAR